MKILVCAKRVVDANVKVRVSPNNLGLEIEHSKMSLNPFDEHAIEEAVLLKEKQIATEVIALSIGSEKSIDILRLALARGCDRGIFVNAADNYLEPLNIAKIIKKIIQLENIDLVLLGKQAIDDDANQVAQMLAQLLDWPQSIATSKLEFINKNLIQTTEEIDNGSRVIEITLPAVISADLYLNEPRFIKLPQLMLAKKKVVQEILLNSLELDLKIHTKINAYYDGEHKKQCVFLKSVEEIINILHTEKVVL